MRLEDGLDQTEELELIEHYYRQTVAWAPSDEEALAIAQDLLEKAQRGFVVDDTGDRLIYASDPELPVDAEFLVDELIDPAGQQFLGDLVHQPVRTQLIMPQPLDHVGRRAVQHIDDMADTEALLDPGYAR